MVLPLVFVNREVDMVEIDAVVPGLYIVRIHLLASRILKKRQQLLIYINFEILNINTCNNTFFKIRIDSAYNFLNGTFNDAF